MERDSRHFRHLLLFFFDQAKRGSDAYHLIRKTYPESAPAINTCRRWFRRFEGGDFDLQLFNLTGKRKVKNEDLKKLVTEDPYLTQAEMARQLNVSPRTISTYLKTMRSNQRNQLDLASQTGSHLKKRKKKVKDEDFQKLVTENPYLTQAEMARQLNVSQKTISTYFKTMRLHQRIQFDLSNQIRCTTCVSLHSRHNKEKHFLDQVVTGGVMSIFCDTSNQTETNASNKNEIKLCIWWDTEGVIYYELLRSNESSYNSFSQHLHKLKQELDRKRPQVANKRRKVILLHTSFAEINILKSVKEQILEFHWEVLPYPAAMVDSAPSYYVFPHLENAYKNLTSFEKVNKRTTMIPFFDAHLFIREIHSLPENWEKCIKKKKPLLLK